MTNPLKKARVTQKQKNYFLSFLRNPRHTKMVYLLRITYSK